MVLAEYEKKPQKFYLKMRFFCSITGTNFRWNSVLWRIFALLVWIGLWKKLKIYIVPPDPSKWYCRGI